MTDAIVFLDIDGVLNNTTWSLHANPPFGCDPSNVRALNLLVERSGAGIVIISEWRRLMAWNVLCGRLRNFGVKGEIIDRTPCLNHDSPLSSRPVRGSEVDAWLRTRAHAGGYVILDDRGDHQPHLHRLLLVNPDRGFTEERVEEAMGLLEGLQTCRALKDAHGSEL